MRKQNGQIIRRSGKWYVSYWQQLNSNGAIERKRVTHYLGEITTRGEYVPADIKQACADHMAKVTGSKVEPTLVVTVSDFAEHIYLPFIQAHRAMSTHYGYTHDWQCYLKPVVAQDHLLKDVRCMHVQSWLESVAAHRALGKKTLGRVKSFLSGMFKLALQRGYFDGVNPVQGTAIVSTATRPVKKKHAYSIEEINAILAALPEPAKTAFAIAAYAGLRLGEILGLRWQDYRDGELHVEQSVWRGKAKKPKTTSSLAPVPVIRPLAVFLDMHQLRSGNPTAGTVIATAKGTPYMVSNLVDRMVMPALEKAGIEWHGFHAARRGLGSNLYRLGVPDKVIQAILRHDDVDTTRTYYIKTTDDDARSAMNKLENSLQETQGRLISQQVQ